MKPLDIKSTRPSRQELAAAHEWAETLDVDDRDVHDISAIVNELLALQHGAEELAHKWRTGGGWGGVGKACADELDKLMRGES